MLIIPVGHKPDWHHIPFATLLLVLINCVIYFGFQAKEHQNWQTAGKFYFEVHLQEIEFSRYELYLRNKGDIETADQVAKQISAQDGSVLGRIQHDHAFQEALQHNGIVKENEAIYNDWKYKRTTFERLLGSSFTDQYALNSENLRPITFLSHMFLHGSFGHLFGNMLILLLVGYIVEDTLGSLRFLVFYLLGGLGAAGVYLLASSGQASMVGASGAIASAMGMYSVLFGLRKIEFFYWILIYFDLARLPAIVLLPIWLANELFQKMTMTDSNVAYMAHVGGLITGAFLVFLARLVGNINVDKLFETENHQAEFAADLQRAADLVKKLDLDRARLTYLGLLDKYPGNLEILENLFNLCKNQPNSPYFVRLCHKAFAINSKDPGLIAIQVELYQNYARIPDAMPVPTSQALELVNRFIAFNYLKPAEHLLHALLKRGIDHHNLAGLTFALIKRQGQNGQVQAASANAQRLRQQFPEAQETQLLVALGY